MFPVLHIPNCKTASIALHDIIAYKWGTKLWESGNL